MKVENFRIVEGDPQGAVIGCSPLNMQDLQLLELSDSNERAIYTSFRLPPPEKSTPIEQFDKM